jgi:hypothetical protein
VLAVVIVLVSLNDGAPDLVELGRVAYVVFAGFLKNRAVFSCLSFLRGPPRGRLATKQGQAL